YVTSSNADGALSVGETWTIKATRMVQAGDADPLPNTVTVSANPEGFPNVITPDADSVLTHSVDLFKPGVDVQKSILGNPTSVVVGTTITFHFTITNTSDGDLNTPALDDPNNNTPDLIFDSISDPLLGNLTSNVIAAGLNVLDFGETGSFDVNYTVQPTD